MTDDHLEAFVRESEESVIELNNSLLALEDDPDDEEAMETIFRTAHTLKGNFAAMGFTEASDLAHAIEDLLDEIRDGEMAVTPEVMDLIFDGVDLIEDILGEIEATGEVETDPGDTEAAIREMLADGGPTPDDAGADDEAPDAAESAGDEGDDEAGEAAGDDGLDETAAAALDAVDADLSGLDAVVHAHVELEESEMPGVDGMLFVESAEEELDLVGTVPEPDAVSEGDHDGSVEVFVASDDPDAVEDTTAGLGHVETVTATDVTGGAGGDERFDRAEGEEAADGDDEDGADAGAEGDDAEADDTDGDEEADSDGADSDGDDEETVKSVRVDIDQLDELYNLVEQLVTSRIKLRRSVETGDVEAAADTLDELDKVTTSLQGTVMDMRLIPLSKVVNTFPRMVRDIARSQGKEIDFEMEGTDVELDRTILDEISDPLMHILRNAADHGVEPPDEREAAGKPREGKIRLRARRERDHVEIQVEDDGAGLDADDLREKAAEEGIRSQAELAEMPDDDVYDLVFHPGFSTAEEVTDVSGRGVGMDVVSSTVSRLDGSVDVDSEPGAGTTVTLRLPVSVAIVRVLFVEVRGREYGIPVKTVDEITDTDEIRVANGEEVLRHAGEIYPVVRLGEELDVPPAEEFAAADGGRDDDGGMLIRVRPSERKVALCCDAVTRQEEVVIKPFEGSLSNTPGLSGTAVIGDGNVVPILDVTTL